LVVVADAPGARPSPPPGPPGIVHAGSTVLRAGPAGDVEAAEHGLIHRDARVLSRFRLVVDDAPVPLVRAWQPDADRWEAILHRRRAGGRPEGPSLPQDGLEVHRRRLVGPGLVEWLTLTDHSAVEITPRIRIELDADFADVLELRRGRRQTGSLSRTVDPDDGMITWSYVAEADGRRVELGSRVVIVADEPPSVDETGLTFTPRLAGHGSWPLELRVEVLVDGTWQGPAAAAADRARQRRTWRAVRPRLRGPERLVGPFAQAADDLFELRDRDLETRFLGATDGGRWIVDAGMPSFTGLFGRDVLTAGWQASMLGPRATLGALEALAATQADRDDPWRDAEPGKLIHEARSGPLTALGLDPRDAYYGSQTSPAMFVLALSEVWHWTGDTAILRRYRATAERAMAWAASGGDPDGDGFVEYERRSPRGLRNQGWKDSDEAIRHVDGSIVEGPIATVEEQAFSVLALERLAEIETVLGDDRAAALALERATDLRRRWHAAFWMPDEDYYALALDGRKRQVRTIASNAGHALGAGIVPIEHARAVADRLLSPELFSGWGVRSLSARHPSYDPFAYHLGAVWPVEQATFALGCKRYGLHDHLDRLAAAILDVAVGSEGWHVPEAITGHDRAVVGVPVPYPEANRPQAWSASALIQTVQILLGLYPFAPMRVLAVVDPRLPAWLPELTVERLRIGRASVDLRFRRRDDGSADWRVIGRRGSLLVIPAGPPDAVRPAALGRLERVVLGHAPGRLARAARLALGLT
jgi:glycogen debranching enzyme